MATGRSPPPPASPAPSPWPTVMTQTPTASLRDTFAHRGFVVVDDIFSPAEVERTVEAIDRMGEGRNPRKWTINDGAAQHEAFWPVAVHPRLLETVRALFDAPIKFCQHNDVQFGSSSFAWHRDSINRVYSPTLPDWQEEDAQYQLVRCGIYLQPPEHGFHFGVVPGSHRPSGYLERSVFDDNEKRLSILRNLTVKAGGRDVLNERAEWIATRPGQAVFFDPRLIHTGGSFEGKKYSMFLAYGVENRHLQEHYSYYRHMRYDLGYQNMPEGLVRLLKEHDLYAEEQPYVKSLNGAFVPNKGLAMAFRLFNNDG